MESAEVPEERQAQESSPLFRTNEFDLGSCSGPSLKRAKVREMGKIIRATKTLFEHFCEWTNQQN